MLHPFSKWDRVTSCKTQQLCKIFCNNFMEMIVTGYGQCCQHFSLPTQLAFSEIACHWSKYCGVGFKIWLLLRPWLWQRFRRRLVCHFPIGRNYRCFGSAAIFSERVYNAQIIQKCSTQKIVHLSICLTIACQGLACQGLAC